MKEQKIKTCREHYGVDNPGQSEQVKEKMRETCQERYGVEYSGASEIHRQKLSEAWKTKTSEDIANTTLKSKVTKKARYGDENYTNVPKAMATCLERYGYLYAAQSPEIKQKAVSTCIERYGTTNWMYSEEAKALGRLSSNPKLRYNGLMFDSKWELAFYIYCIDHNIQIKREPFGIEYDYHGVIHRYYPDFLLPCGLVEIKADFFFEGDKMINPFNRKEDGLCQAKYECMIKHNVNIIKGQEIKIYLDYVKEHYPNL